MPVRVLALVLLVLFAHLAAEAPPAPAFASVSIRPAAAAGRSVRLQADLMGDRWTMVNGTVRTLLDAAYPTEGGEVLNAPDWIDDERFDITAHAAAAPSGEELQAMLRSLLEHRFAFRGHVEQQERWAPDARDGHEGRVRVQVLVIKHVERPTRN